MIDNGLGLGCLAPPRFTVLEIEKVRGDEAELKGKRWSPTQNNHTTGQRRTQFEEIVHIDQPINYNTQ